MAVVPGREPLQPLLPAEVDCLYRHSGRDPDLVSGLPCPKCAAKAGKLCGGGAGGVASPAQRGRVSYGMQRVKQLLDRHAHLLPRYI